MDMDGLLEACRSKKGSTEDFPFDESTLVFRIGGKIFALTDLGGKVPRVNLKCDPFIAEALREEYGSVIPGYHMNKRHWNTVILDGSIPDERVLGMIDHSFDLVCSSIGKQARKELGIDLTQPI